VKQDGNLSLADKINPWRRLEEWIGNKPSLSPRWDPVEQLRASCEAALLPYQARYEKLEKQWKLKLKPLCGGFCGIDWERFRPLRQSREEDWSDWLAWLLETSVTGLLAETLIGTYMKCDPDSFRSPEKKVRREVLTENRERRGDIVAEWNKYLITPSTSTCATREPRRSTESRLCSRSGILQQHSSRRLLMSRELKLRPSSWLPWATGL
jgi:hypothetical protein